MREEWETETGIKVLDGWNFQVNATVIFLSKINSRYPSSPRSESSGSCPSLNGLSRP